MTSADVRSEPAEFDHPRRGQLGFPRVVRAVDTVGKSVGDGAPESRAGYWNDFYAATATARRILPSQFAAFVAGELAGPSRIVELGCGAGRDAIFFAENGHEVLAVDASAGAVAAAQSLANHLGVDVEFVCAPINHTGLQDLVSPSTKPTVVYARFFVHAITDDEEADFLDLAAALTHPGDLLAVEYRTVRDKANTKVTGKHYRRFVHPSAFDAAALMRGFDIQYAVEGYGYAKYRGDDAYVARSIFVRRSRGRSDSGRS